MEYSEQSYFLVVPHHKPNQSSCKPACTRLDPSQTEKEGTIPRADSYLLQYQ